MNRSWPNWPRLPPVEMSPGEKLFFSRVIRLAASSCLYPARSGSINHHPMAGEYTIHIIRPGQLFAEAAIFRGHHFPANCSALEDSEVVFFPKEDFTALLKQSPQISLKIIGALAAFVRDFTRQVEDLSLKEVPSRIASYLLDKYETTGRKEIILDISKSELASHLGTISETLSRKLTFLKELGAIRGDGPAITLMDIPLLRKIADGRKI